MGVVVCVLLIVYMIATIFLLICAIVSIVRIMTQ